MGWLLLVFWLCVLLPLWPTLFYRWLRRLAEGVALEHWPRVSVIVPARNEGRAKVEAGLRSLANLDYPNLEILAIDDRSTDDTGTTMDAVAAECPSVRVLHITELPPGWLGKNHALHTAGLQATGDWLLFTDGDVQFAPEALRLAIAYVETGGRGGSRPFDFLCLAPRIIPGSFLENSLVSFFGFALTASVQPILFRSKLMFAYCGIGAFNLVRRNVWQAVGGHSLLRMDVLDDVHFGKLIKHSGYRCDMLFSGGLVRVRWQESLWGVIHGLEKNAFASMQYSVGKLAFVTALFGLTVFWPYVAVAIFRGWPLVPYAATLAALHVTFAFYGLRNRLGWTGTFVLPLSALLFLYACWRSAAITLRQGGVRWRDTFYTLKELRELQLDVRTLTRTGAEHGAD